MANMTGGEAFARRLDELVAESGAKGWRAKFNYLVQSAAGQQAMIGAGINLHNKSTQRTVLGWYDEEANPSPKNRKALDQAYAARRRATMAKQLEKRLSNNGRGTQVEVYPVDQSGVPANRRRVLDVRRVKIRPAQWAQIIGAWAAGDVGGMQDMWADIAKDTIGSPWRAYLEVEYIGF